MENKFFEIHVEDIYEESLSNCIELSQIKTDTVRGKKLLKKLKDTRENFCKDIIVKIIISSFPRNSVQGNCFIIKDKIIKCDELEQIQQWNIIGGYIYTVFIDNYSYENTTTLEMFYVDCWISSYVEAAWKSIKDLLINEVYHDFNLVDPKEKIYFSKSYAPGFDGISIDSLKDIYELMNLSLYGMKLYDNNMITPTKSIIGIYLVGY